MTPQEKTDLKNKMGKEAKFRYWGGESHFVVSSVMNVINSMPETEHEEVEVPKFIGRYIETTKKKRDLRWAMWDILDGLHDDEFNAWFENDSNFEVFAKAWIYGYKEKEPLYIMPVPYTEEAYYFEISLIGVPKPAKKWEAQKFTLDEINEYFPKIAEFKEEVAE